MSKFKKGDSVRVISNEITKSSVGKIGEITSVGYFDGNPNLSCYKVKLAGHKTALRGWATDTDLELC